MIESFVEKLINELGATGLLVIGLYWILYQPLRQIGKCLLTINHELGEILDCMKIEIAKRTDNQT